MSESPTTPYPYDAHTHLVWALSDARNRIFSLRMELEKRMDDTERMIGEAINKYAAERDND